MGKRTAEVPGYNVHNQERDDEQPVDIPHSSETRPPPGGGKKIFLGLETDVPDLALGYVPRGAEKS